MNTLRAGLALAAMSLLGKVPPAGALDFVLHASTVVDDGIRKEQLYVRNDERTSVLLSLPTRWTRTDSPASLTLTPPDIDNSLVRVEKSTLTPDTPLRDKGLDVYRKRAEADVPQGATGLQCTREQDNPLPIFGWKDYEFVFSYDFFGQAYKRSVVFINLNAREQIMLTCVAPADRFDSVHEAGLDLMRSWQVVAAR